MTNTVEEGRKGMFACFTRFAKTMHAPMLVLQQRISSGQLASYHLITISPRQTSANVAVCPQLHKMHHINHTADSAPQSSQASSIHFDA
jgi:hypothetical protein